MMIKQEIIMELFGALSWFIPFVVGFTAMVFITANVKMANTEVKFKKWEKTTGKYLWYSVGALSIFGIGGIIFG